MRYPCTRVHVLEPGATLSALLSAKTAVRTERRRERDPVTRVFPFPRAVADPRSAPPQHPRSDGERRTCSAGTGPPPLPSPRGARARRRLHASIIVYADPRHRVRAPSRCLGRCCARKASRGWRRRPDFQPPRPAPPRSPTVPANTSAVPSPHRSSPAQRSRRSGRPPSRPRQSRCLRPASGPRPRIAAGPATPSVFCTGSQTRSSRRSRGRSKARGCWPRISRRPRSPPAAAAVGTGPRAAPRGRSGRQPAARKHVPGDAWGRHPSRPLVRALAPRLAAVVREPSRDEARRAGRSRSPRRPSGNPPPRSWTSPPRRRKGCRSRTRPRGRHPGASRRRTAPARSGPPPRRTRRPRRVRRTAAVPSPVRSRSGPVARFRPPARSGLCAAAAGAGRAGEGAAARVPRSPGAASSRRQAAADRGAGRLRQDDAFAEKHASTANRGYAPPVCRGRDRTRPARRSLPCRGPRAQLPARPARGRSPRSNTNSSNDLAGFVDLRPIQPVTFPQRRGTDAGLVPLAATIELRSPDLARTAVGDARLPPVLGLPERARLVLVATRTTAAPIARLRRRWREAGLPEVESVR